MRIGPASTPYAVRMLRWQANRQWENELKKAGQGDEMKSAAFALVTCVLIGAIILGMNPGTALGR